MKENDEDERCVQLLTQNVDAESIALYSGFKQYMYLSTTGNPEIADATLLCSRQHHFEPNTLHVKINATPCAFVQKSKFSTMTLLCLHNMTRLSHDLDELRTN